MLPKDNEKTAYLSKVNANAIGVFSVVTTPPSSEPKASNNISSVISLFKM